MPQFVNPYQGNITKEMNRFELIQALLIDIAAELEAIFQYGAIMNAISDDVPNKAWIIERLADIRNEEKEHVGELMAILYKIDPTYESYLKEGIGEVTGSNNTDNTDTDNT